MGEKGQERGEKGGKGLDFQLAFRIFQTAPDEINVAVFLDVLHLAPCMGIIGLNCREAEVLANGLLLEMARFRDHLGKINRGKLDTPFGAKSGSLNENAAEPWSFQIAPRETVMEPT